MEYTLPKLDFDYTDLEPHYDAQTVELHHTKHHAGYVAGLNNAVTKLKEARESGDFSLVKHWEKELAFHGAGHELHSLFWKNLRKGSDENKAEGKVLEAIENSFGSYDSFVKQFSSATATVEGSGWGVLASDVDGNLHIFTVENHQKAFIPGYKILLVCDVWEHAYYLKYQNRRAEWIENFFKIINWEEVEKRL